MGVLRPDMVLYDEVQPTGADIGLLLSQDLKRSPDFLLVLGTSLKLAAIRRLVKDFASVVHEKSGLGSSISSLTVHPHP